eukprot:615325-Rhodomonas_salina.1
MAQIVTKNSKDTKRAKTASVAVSKPKRNPAFDSYILCSAAIQQPAEPESTPLPIADLLNPKLQDKPNSAMCGLCYISKLGKRRRGVQERCPRCKRLPTDKAPPWPGL